MRVDRCFAFVDLCGFTAFTERHGDERVVVVLAELRTALRESAARRGVRVVKWLGDGAMLSSTMSDAVIALVVELDVRMREAIPSLAVRAGLDSGPVIMFEGDDYIGRSVNVASRLCDLARPHEIIATPRVAGAAPSWISVEPSPAARIRSFESPIEACRLSLAESDDDSVVDPICGLSLPRALSIPATSQDGGSACFCSPACAGSWTGQVPAAHDSGFDLGERRLADETDHSR
jgi:adenylate cyclase